MGVRIEGLVSKKVVLGWLENYDSLVSGDRPFDAMPSNSGAKVFDGVSGGQMNKIMLEAAIRDLPPVLHVCLVYRWVERRPLWEALRRTGIPKSTYYRRCAKAVEFIYYHVNGIAAGIKDLLTQIGSNSRR